MPSRFVIALLCASVFAVPAVADDSSAALGMGGLQFTKAANIRMATEDLFISPNAVRIRYEFANDGSADVDSIVAFPLPDIDTYEFYESPIGTVGNEPRGYCFGPNFRNVDAQLAKNWTFKERFHIKFSLDFFNLFNHANFIDTNLDPAAGFTASGLLCGASKTAWSPTNNVVSAQEGNPNSISSGFGQATNVHPGREIQYTLKFTF